MPAVFGSLQFDLIYVYQYFGFEISNFILIDASRI